MKLYYVIVKNKCFSIVEVYELNNTVSPINKKKRKKPLESRRLIQESCSHKQVYKLKHWAEIDRFVICNGAYLSLNSLKKKNNALN